MPSVSTTASASPAFQQGFAQLKIQQAKRAAEQAEASARALQAQAQDARRAAEQAQETASELSVRSRQADHVAGRAREGLAAIRSLSDTSTRLEQTYERVAASMRGGEGVAAAPAAAPVEAISTVPPVAAVSAAVPAVPAGGVSVNALGQATGKVVNTVA